MMLLRNIVFLLKIKKLNFFTLFLAAFLVSCSSQRDRLAYVDGLPSTPNAKALKISTENQIKVFDLLLIRAGLKPFCSESQMNDCENITQGNNKWDSVVDAGLGYVDEQCGKYIDALFWYNRFKKTTSNQLSITGASTASIMGLLKSSAKQISLVATTFGLTSTSFNNLTSHVLYQLEPSGIKVLIDRSKVAYRSIIEKGRLASPREAAANKPQAMRAIAGYLSLCLPATIETNINTAIQSSQFEKVGSTSAAVPAIQAIEFKAKVGNEPKKATDKVSATQPKKYSKYIKYPKGEAEEKLLFSSGKTIQAALCVNPDGDFRSDTRTAIALYNATVKYAASHLDASDQLSSTSISLLTGEKNCDLKVYTNAYERFEYSSQDKIVQLQKNINRALQEDSQLKGKEMFTLLKSDPYTGVFDKETKTQIEKIKTLGFALPYEPLGLTPALDYKLTP
jgi:hypothetical protein